MRIDRMLGIVVILLNRDRISAKYLSERFEVSVRTIYRDIESINLAGIPIVAYAGNNGGFGIMENYRLDRQVLTLQDMTSILTALKGVSSTLEDNDLDNVTEKILSLVPNDKLDLLKQRFDEFCIDIMPWGYKPKTKEYLKDIQRAISEKILIQFDYRNTKNEKGCRIIEPMTLVFKGYAWYLFGFCRSKNDFRIFKIIRMNNLSLTGDSFKRKEKSYQDFAKQPSEQLKLIDVVLHYKKEYRGQVEEYYDEANILYNDDESITVKFSVPNDSWLQSMILASGEYVEVIEPAYLRNIIKEKAERILLTYKDEVTV
jgi:predicted DNA-binding transcriptional regulator YafY